MAPDFYQPFLPEINVLYQRFFVLTDYSENVFNTLNYICRILHHMISEIFIVHSGTFKVYTLKIQHVS